jgi:hypothetical protein
MKGPAAALRSDVRPQTVAYLQAVFELRVEARAILVTEGEMDFYEAVDGLQAAAVAYGLVAELGQDTVQLIIGKAFATVPRAGELEDAVAVMADLLDDYLVEMASKPQRSDCPRSTRDAVAYLMKQNDPCRLRNFLARHTAQERAAIRKHFFQGSDKHETGCLRGSAELVS